MSGFYCDVKPNICMKKDQKVVQRPVPDAYEFSPIPDSEEEGRLLTKGDVIKAGLLESGVYELDGLDDFVTMGLKGEALVEDGTERRFWI